MPTEPLAGETGINDVVSIEINGSVGLIALDNPPVNAASHAIRSGLWQAVDTLQQTDGVEVIALYAKGRTFIAGADIREFGKPPLDPWLPELCNFIESASRPIVCVLHGTTLGGGLEVAMSCHARVALKGSKVGLPEVTLGILPGAGGTQRAPRLAGIATALDMITSGKPMAADEALSHGLIDRIVEGDPRDIALSSAKDLLAGDLPNRKTGELTAEPDPAAIKAMRTKLAKSQPLLFSPHKCVDAVEACHLPIREGMKEERRLYEECMASPQRAGLIHAFFSERAVTKIPEATATAREINSVGVIGGGTMGSGIATAILLVGLPVTLTERDQDGLDRGVATITRNLEGAVKRGKLSAEARDDILAAKLTTSTDLAALAEADLVIEAVFEDMGVKREIFQTLDKVCKPGTVLASNTSYLDINEIAATTSRPQDVIGLHFFSPAHVMRLLEVVVADKTGADVVATGFALARKLKKIAVRSGVCDGFIGNRIMTFYKKTADYMMMDGASPEEIDTAMRGFGFAMGPYQVADLAGLDISWAANKRRAATRPAEERYIPIADRLCENGWFGRKTGQGFYIYDDQGSRPNPEALAIIDAEREKAGVTPRSFTEEEIVSRFMTAMISEVVRVLEEGIALRPIDIDAVFLNGYGFPRFRGGPLHTADVIGPGELVRRIEEYAKEDAYYWKVPGLLRTMSETGGTFAEMNAKG
ncbi:Enoyl-CoA hydratase/isomerase:3-hydroxyacyl-CoA dehydrogenase, 3-hydroxyacyl-CoA dehydrogenase, NAD-binding protein [Stappia aggregata IAM 12614]|uniref:Enoyl-CoA hydratase/isomerase:3-hydroxyacyl-CoA dehydrogenase, 3-hydroxyacyl-CoA dehydrogenase, NAD-binding protein n=1 Tax=Roseibium aggregatum (strain ATCC 25650 / DSM 13394 / JCM 20685 / NBRC 16684 / NCIMB 2208 / IAM 12614 / B1) TaxID=384765 RepID=A0NU70_ROSAI|nr:3-hydroxyacyl-CoA dehydrogenase NAD-binding domain-containing protein [Roseibium aggregatum]EAV43472.1 Enoyl-CoA hydratase/isomerase:3-hydroxyacyl-CoA dehydrogenase, 3-hydroxyacyl-CoA dehydrogenase, NAD-binding protein [Stappia aggregata IAM 12614] [Roseibium aggregatum IAM 12614]